MNAQIQNEYYPDVILAELAKLEPQGGVLAGPVSRRGFLKVSAAAGGGLVLGFSLMGAGNEAKAGAPGGFGSAAARFGWDSRIHPRRLLAFVLDGTGKLPPTPPPVFAKPLDAPEFTVDEALVKEGIQQWSRCQLCHGPGAVAGGTAPEAVKEQIQKAKNKMQKSL